MLSLPFKPVHFLRAHSRKNDPADVGTQVWQVAFEPDLYVPGQFKNTIATCGGPSICFIDSISGKVEKKFISEDKGEQFFCLAWSTLLGEDGRLHSVLAAGGNKQRLLLFDPAQNIAVPYPKFLRSRKKSGINALHFHPEKKNLLFCGLSEGSIILVQVHLKERDSLVEEPLQTYDAGSEVFQLCWSPGCSTLLAACNDGLRAWTNPILGESQRLDIVLPTPPNSHSGPNMMELVDSIVSLGGPLLATKQALQGHILVWDLAKALKEARSERKIYVDCGRFLRWSPTDNFFMGLGYNAKLSMLCGGDDKGCLWLYDVSNIGDLEQAAKTCKVLEPTNQLFWPNNLKDRNLEKCRKLKIDTYDIVVDHVASVGNVLAAVTNNNLVCLWQLQ